MKWFFSFCGITLMATHILAHPFDIGYMVLKINKNTIFATLELNPQLAQNLIKSSEPISNDFVQKNDRAYFLATLNGSTLRLNAGSGDEKCSWVFESTELLEQNLKINAHADCSTPITELQMKLNFIGETPDSFQLLGRTEMNGQESVIEARKGSETIKLNRESNEISLTQFILMGVEHIGAHPDQWWGPDGFKIAEGIDHILFIVALILVSTSLTQLLISATGFTLGHSLTLALATLDLVHLPSGLVEAVIALSIMFVAAETKIPFARKHQWKIATFFGLIHGFGFANALKELHLNSASVAKALFGFNLGVELAQIAFIVVLAPVMIKYGDRPNFKRFFTYPVSLLIFVLAGYWFIQRSFF